jgi:hypothetical protein
LRATRALHIFYQEGAFDEGELTRTVQQAGYAGVPVAITEARVGDEARPWERQADILVALSQTEADRLRRRWPGKRVEHLPVPNGDRADEGISVENRADPFHWYDEQHRKLWLTLTQSRLGEQHQ